MEALEQPQLYFTAEADVTFELYTLQNVIKPQIISILNTTTVTSSNFNKTHPTRIYIHGFQEYGGNMKKCFNDGKLHFCFLIKFSFSLIFKVKEFHNFEINIYLKYYLFGWHLKKKYFFLCKNRFWQFQFSISISSISYKGQEKCQSRGCKLGESITNPKLYCSSQSRWSNWSLCGCIGWLFSEE